MSHLKLCHKAVYEQHYEVAAASVFKKRFARNSEKSNAINCKIIEFLTIDDQPFSVVEDLGFRQLETHLEPRYSLPSHPCFSYACPV